MMLHVKEASNKIIKSIIFSLHTIIEYHTVIYIDNNGKQKLLKQSPNKNHFYGSGIHSI